MDNAYSILVDKLELLGMNQIDIEYLLAQFLEEEAFDYVHFIADEIKDIIDEKAFLELSRVN